MGYAEDLAEARKMKTCIERYGVKVSIELQAGAGGSWSLSTFRLIMSHHTASRRSQGLTPCLGIVKRGRGGAYPVPGPLANGYMGYDGIYRILTFGRANHPGAGGPITLDGVRVPKDNGRPYIWGTEFEGGFEPYTDEMHDFMARANAGLTDYFAQRCGASVAANLEHKTWAPTRKPDRIGYTRETSIARINAVRTNPHPDPTTSEEDDDMPKAIQFTSKGTDGKTHVYIAFPNARQYDYAESQGEIDDYRNILTRQGFDYEVWKNRSGSSNVGNPDVFGRYVGPEAARPAAATRKD